MGLWGKIQSFQIGHPVQDHELPKITLTNRVIAQNLHANRVVHAQR